MGLFSGIKRMFGFGKRRRSGGGGGGMKADEMQAQMTREQFADLQNRLLPILDRQYRELDNPNLIRNRARQASSDATSSVNAQRKALSRTMMPQNRALSADQRRAMQDTLQTEGALASANAGNMARTRTRDEIMASRMDALGIEQGLAAGASQAASQAASLQSQREQMNQANKMQHKQQKYQMLGTGLGLLGMFMLSDRDAKTDIRRTNGAAIDRELDKINIKQFKFKPEVGVGDGDFIGPIAQELPKMFQGPDGKSMNTYSMLGAMLDRQKRLDKRLKKVEGRKRG